MKICKFMKTENNYFEQLKSIFRKCKLDSHFPIWKPNLKSVASQTTEKILSQILWAIPYIKESLHKKSDYSKNWSKVFFLENVY